MIVDLLTHVWQSPEQLGPSMAYWLRRRYGRPGESIDAGPGPHEEATSGLHMAAVVGFRSRFLGAAVPNTLVAAHVARYADRRIGFAGMDPMEPETLRELDNLKISRLTGVSISPAAQDYHPTHTRAMAFYEKCQSLGVPVIIHPGPLQVPEIKMQYAQPWHLDEVARAFPNLRIAIAHCGQPWIGEALHLLDKHEHVYAIISHLAARPWSLYTTLLEAHQLRVLDKLFFGSDFPFCQPKLAIENLFSVNRFTHGSGLPVVPRERLRSIVERHPYRFLGMEPPEAAEGGKGETAADGSEAWGIEVSAGIGKMAGHGGGGGARGGDDGAGAG